MLNPSQPYEKALVTKKHFARPTCIVDIMKEPNVISIQFTANEMVDFCFNNYWVSPNVPIKILLPYDVTEPAAIDYIKDIISKLELCPFDNCSCYEETWLEHSKQLRDLNLTTDEVASDLLLTGNLEVKLSNKVKIHITVRPRRYRD